MSESRDRPFTRWRLRPFVGEPAHGYFARLVADEGHPSVKIYATEIGLNGRNIVPEEMLAALLRLPLGDGDFALLRAATPMLRDKHYLVGTERLAFKQLAFKRRRYCPCCLRKAAYHRTQWDVVVATHCAVHRVPLVDGRFGWWWPHFDVTPRGESTTAMLEPTVAVLPFHDLLRDRLELGVREVGPFADRDLCDVVSTARYFARYVGPDGGMASPVQNRVGDIEAAFAMMLMSHEDMVEWFRDWYSSVIPAETLRRGYHASTNVAQDQHQGRRGNVIWADVEKAQYEGFASVGNLGRKHARFKVARSDRTLKEVAAELTVPVKGLREFIRFLDLLPGRVWDKTAISLDDQTAERIKALVGDLITLPQTISITGVPGHEFRQLAKAGLVSEFHGMTVGGVEGPKYLASEVRRVVAHFRSLEVTGRTATTKTLCGYARCRGIKQGEVLARTLRGDLIPAVIDLSRNGLRALHYSA